MSTRHTEIGGRFAWHPAAIVFIVFFLIPFASSRATNQHIGIEKAYPNLEFRRPVYITHAPGGDDAEDLVYVVEQQGVISIFENSPEASEKKVILDIEHLVSRRGNEEGLLGLAFHPKFAENGHIFVHYSSAPVDHNGIVARFTVDPDTGVADRSSEKRLIVQPQKYRNHNGGMIEFGPDGYLYIAFGDGGWRADPLRAGQDLKTLLGKILRIDVDRTEGDLPYAIPTDNPFAMRDDGTRREIWAYGLRNVWRFSFDRLTGRLWAGDVGQDRLEEISIIEKGGNYGWSVYEGSRAYHGGDKLVGDHIKPVFEYVHPGIGMFRKARSVTGGYVYRGKKLPSLQGAYICGDYETGEVWALTPNSNGGGYDSRLIVETEKKIASFGEDRAGELYFTAFDGSVYRFVELHELPEVRNPFPETLTETGLFASVPDHEPAESLHAYDVNSPLWSDGAAKYRFIQLPEKERIGFRAQAPWRIPVGTTFVKTFSWPLKNGGERRLETRLIRKLDDGWAASTYAWNEEQTEAFLKPDGANINFETDDGQEMDWAAPSSADCRGCHLEGSEFVLGIRTDQLNKGAQLDALAASGALKGFFDHGREDWPRLADPYDPNAPLEDRVRSYLDVNCAFCHNPMGPGNAAIDLRITTPLAETNMIGTTPDQGDLGRRGSKIVAPGKPRSSVLVTRMQTLEVGRMPPLASAVQDRQAIEMLAKWIRGLEE